MKKLKEFFQEKFILSAVMCMLLALVLVSATYGWYALNNTNKAYGLQLKNGGIGGIKVAVVPGGEDIMTEGFTKVTKEDKVYAIIPIKLTELTNSIEEGKIAPGAYGPMNFYITALAENVKYYSIKVQLEYEPSDKAEEAQKEKIQEIINDHINVYQNKSVDSRGVTSFSNPLTYYKDEADEVTDAKGNLEYNVEVPVELYWVWNYEVIDIPDYRGIERFSQTDEKSAIRKYDEEDTILGNYINDIWFNIYIEGRMEEE